MIRVTDLCIFQGEFALKDVSFEIPEGEYGVLMGKTVSTEFASRHPGATRNPHNPAHTPGGSSSGSAAMLSECPFSSNSRS